MFDDIKEIWKYSIWDKITVIGMIGGAFLTIGCFAAVAVIKIVQMF